MVSSETGLPKSFNLETGENIKWIANIGSHGYATPIVADGALYISTANKLYAIKKAEK